LARKTQVKRLLGIHPGFVPQVFLWAFCLSFARLFMKFEPGPAKCRPGSFVTLAGEKLNLENAKGRRFSARFGI
jgi:hypothetical protein